MRNNQLILIVITTLFSLISYGQWTYPNSNNISTTDEVTAPVFLVNNEIRIPNTFVATDPSIGTLDNSHYGINLHKTNGIGFAFNGVHQLVFKPNGDTGIGTDNPLGRLHVSTGTSGDAILRLESDTDNNNESDNPLIQFRQDGGTTGINMGFSEENFGGNIFGIGTKYASQEQWNTLAINTNTGNVGIGTNAPSEKLQVKGLIRLDKATSTDNNSPGIVLASNDDFLYDGQYLNNYGFGFHGFNDGSNGHTEPANTYVSGYWGMDFFTNRTNRLRISHDGIVSIGTTERQVGYKLAVNGKIKAKEIKVETGWADYVFEKNYELPTLKEVENHIKEKGHLKDIPSAAEVKENGISLGEMDSKLLQKIEELTLYTIQQQKEIETYQKSLLVLSKKMEALEKHLKNLKN